MAPPLSRIRHTIILRARPKHPTPLLVILPSPNAVLLTNTNATAFDKCHHESTPPQLSSAQLNSLFLFLSVRRLPFFLSFTSSNSVTAAQEIHALEGRRRPSPPARQETCESTAGLPPFQTNPPLAVEIRHSPESPTSTSTRCRERDGLSSARSDRRTKRRDRHREEVELEKRREKSESHRKERALRSFQGSCGMKLEEEEEEEEEERWRWMEGVSCNSREGLVGQ
ncbi:hypothetical protein MARPO_0009s0100 [Marchantia polymorpha]|uniref:Uncharacterized protein n=1 Tax=Marchantia polymorpha TaxID=3197 RepID=A0A2R6XLR5_MARPO|nr:hypothetical protein MARPO_0009s0100 [Marchantia polymorpha]|eukprot:PTQ46996.1 hypothetical protein MARPO_0009s0100 [Marchantia polymorpha]